jgi:hypothetical protein
MKKAIDGNSTVIISCPSNVCQNKSGNEGFKVGFGTNLKKPEFRKISDYVWEIDPAFKKGMRVPARVYATRKLLDDMDLQVYDQLTNVATLPGIVRHAYCMPDGHIFFS